MKSSRDATVAIVGGGPAGSSLAFFLARRGVRVLVVDRARFPRSKPCAEYLSPQASRILASMNVLEEVEGAGSARWPRRYALVTHYRGVGEITDIGEMHVERGGYVGIADVGEGLTTVALVVSQRHARAFASGREQFLDAWLAARPHLAARFAHATRVSPVVATGPFASRARRPWSPGAALVGD